MDQAVDTTLFFWGGGGAKYVCLVEFMTCKSILTTLTGAYTVDLILLCSTTRRRPLGLAATVVGTLHTFSSTCSSARH